MTDNVSKALREYFLNACGRLNLELTESEISKFFEYKDLLISWNKKFNLTAITDEKEIIIKHFVDSLSVSPFIGGNEKVIDVGTGAGFPGLPVKIVRSKMELTLLDSLKKRIAFLQYLKDKLELSYLDIIHGRAEAAGRSYEHRAKYDVSMSRAVAPLNVLSEYCLPFVKEGGFFLALKSGDVESEIKEARNALEILGGEVSGVNCFRISVDGGEPVYRSIVKISKIKNTPDNYPRREGLPSKRPL